MTERDAHKLVVIDFDESIRAQEFLLAAMGLVKSGDLALHDAVFVIRAPDGRSTVRETTDLTPGRGALGGAVWGVLIGTLLGGPVGALVGGAASAGGGALLAKLIDTGIKDDQVRRLRDTVRPGTTALALLVSRVSVAALQRELSRFPGATVMQSDLPDASLHAVRDAMDEPPVVSDDPNVRIGLDDEPGIRRGLDDEPGVRRGLDDVQPPPTAPAAASQSTDSSTPGGTTPPAESAEPGAEPTSPDPHDPDIRIGLDDDPAAGRPGSGSGSGSGSDPTAPPA